MSEAQRGNLGTPVNNGERAGLVYITQSMQTKIFGAEIRIYCEIKGKTVPCAE